MQKTHSCALDFTRPRAEPRSNYASNISLCKTEGVLTKGWKENIFWVVAVDYTG